MKVATSAFRWGIGPVWSLLSSCDVIISSQTSVALAEACDLEGIELITYPVTIDSPDQARRVVEELAESIDTTNLSFVTHGDLSAAFYGWMRENGLRHEREITTAWLDEHPEHTHRAFKLRYPMPSVALEKGTIVHNFSSGHPFHFDDGSVLPACHSSRVDALKARSIEIDVADEMVPPDEYDANFATIMLEFAEEPVLRFAFRRILANPENIPYRGDYVILLPLPIMQVFKAMYPTATPFTAPFRVIRAKERAKDGRGPVIFSNKFCW